MSHIGCSQLNWADRCLCEFMLGLRSIEIIYKRVSALCQNWFNCESGFLSRYMNIYIQNWHYGPPHSYLINLTVCGVASERAVQKNSWQLRNCYDISNENLIKNTARNEYWYKCLDFAPLNLMPNLLLIIAFITCLQFL